MSNDGLVLTPSLVMVTVSDVSDGFGFRPFLQQPPMMTRLLSWLTVQTLDFHLASVRMSGREIQAPCSALHWVQLGLKAPPQTMLPD